MGKVKFKLAAKRILSLLCVMVLLASFAPAVSAEDPPVTESPEAKYAKFASTPPVFGTDDNLWSQTQELEINQTTASGDETRPKATGKAYVLWDEDALYVRVEVADEDVCATGGNGDHTSDSIEVYLGTGVRGANQWRYNVAGNFSGQSAEGREGWVEQTAEGYTMEVKIPRRDVTFTNDAPISFEVYINNSTSGGNDRYEVVSCMGAPDTAYNSDAAYRDSLTLRDGPSTPRHLVKASAGPNGSISPSWNIRVATGTDLEFTLTPASGYVVDAIEVSGEPVDAGDIVDNTYKLRNVVNSDNVVEVTFKPDPTATALDFIVYNDNFATGEFTTAVIIDLGEGNEARASSLNPSLFTVSAKNTVFGSGAAAYQGTRTVRRVYANSEPRPRGYMGDGENSPGYSGGLAKGRYIVVELEFWSLGGGQTTLEQSNSTIQNYNVAANGSIALYGKPAITKTVFLQKDVVNEIIDKFVAGPTIEGATALDYALYIHKDKNGNPVQGLPLYIYTHGMTRGGEISGDVFAPIRSANGAMALMKKMEENPGEYASHIIALRYTGFFTPNSANVKKYIDDLIDRGLVDPSRIYGAGFSLGGMYTHQLATTYPNLFAAVSTMSAVTSYPNAGNAASVKDVAYWTFVNTTDGAMYQTGANGFISSAMPLMPNARHTFIDRNEIFQWPYDQWTKEEAPINGTNWIPTGHEMEASVLYSNISAKAGTKANTTGEAEWSLEPMAQSAQLPAWSDDYTDVFDWMYTQQRDDPPEGAYAKFANTPPVFGTNDPVWEEAPELLVDNTNAAEGETRPLASGKARVMWDEDFLYVRVNVTDADVSVAQSGGGSEHMNDSVEVFLGTNGSGGNQWRLGTNGIFAGGQNATGREGYAELTETGYIAELKIPRRTVAFTNDAKITFEISINNSTSKGGDRYEEVTCFGPGGGGYSGVSGYTDSITLWGAPKASRHIVTATAGKNGSISPSGAVRVADGGNQTFTFTPISGYVVDAVTVNGQAVAVVDNSYTLENVVRDDLAINVTFKYANAGQVLDFIVYNDNFATGEFTTAVIIDLGEGKEAKTADLSPAMFTVTAKDTMMNGALAYAGTRIIKRVYANSEPRPLGYLGDGENSPDYAPGLEKGRYIVVELEFWTVNGGNVTLQGSDSTIQNYNIAANSAITLSDGETTIPQTSAFSQTDVVNEIIDQFVVGPKISDAQIEYGLYIHKDANGNPVQGLPLYIYTHGSTRGGTQEGDTFAPIRSASGAIALMKKIEENPGKYASHIIALRARNNNAASAATVKAYVDDMVNKGLVDPNRVYASGFSMGASFTNTLLTSYPELLAAAAPIAISPISANNATSVKNVAYWTFANTTDTVAWPSWGTNTFINGALKNTMTNARATIIDRNEVFAWPYDQWTTEQAPINGTNWIGAGHEMEASVLYSQISAYPGTKFNTNSEKEWSLIPAQSPALGEWNDDYTDIFDWMFSQKREYPTYLSITPEHVAIYAGERTTLTLTVEPADTAVSAINWSTSDAENAILTIAPSADKKSAVVTAKTSGLVTITAEAPGYAATATVEVFDAPINAGTVGNYKAEILADKVSVNKAKVDGVLVPISITKKQPERTAAAAKSTGISTQALAMQAVNTSQTIQAVELIGADAANFKAIPVSDRYVMINADPEKNVANKTYKNLGLKVTFVGDATIETDKTLQVTVTESYPKITLKAAELNLFYTGEVGAVTGTAADGSAVSITELKAANEKVVAIDAEGKTTYTAVAKGSAKLTASVQLAGYHKPYKNGNTATVTAKVVNTAPKLKLSPSTVTLSKPTSSATDITIAVLPSNAKQTLADIGEIESVKLSTDSDDINRHNGNGLITIPASATGKPTVSVKFVNGGTVKLTLTVKTGDNSKATISAKTKSLSIHKDHTGDIATIEMVPNIQNLRNLALAPKGTLPSGISVAQVPNTNLVKFSVENGASLTAGRYNIDIEASAMDTTFKTSTARVTLTIIDKKASFSVSLKGSVNILDPSSAATATVKLSNTVSALETVSLTGTNKDLFEVTGISGNTFKIKRANGQLLAPGAKFSLGVDVTLANGQSMSLAKPITVTTVQSAAKVSQSVKEITLYKKAPKDGGEVRMSLTSPANTKIGLAQLNAASVAGGDYFQLVRNGDDSWTVKFRDDIDPASVSMKGSYTVKIELWVDGTYDTMQSSGKPIPLGITDANGKFTAKSAPIIVSVKVNVK